MSDLFIFFLKAKNTCTNYNIYLCVLFIKLSLKNKIQFPPEYPLCTNQAFCVVLVVPHKIFIASFRVPKDIKFLLDKLSQALSEIKHQAIFHSHILTGGEWSAAGLFRYFCFRCLGNVQQCKLVAKGPSSENI